MQTRENKQSLDNGKNETFHLIILRLYGPSQANLVLIAYASSEGSGETEHLLIQAASQEEPSDRKPDPWPLWMAGHAHLKFVMMECSKTQIRLTRPIFSYAGHQNDLNCINLKNFDGINKW